MRAVLRVVAGAGIGRPRISRLNVLALLAAALIAIAYSFPATASETESDNKPAVTHKIAVIGDSLAQDLYNGLHKLYRGQEKVELIKFTRVSTGLVRDDVFDWNDRIKQFVADQKFDIVIVLMGGNDRQGIIVDGKRLKRFSKPWAAEYGDRVDDMIKTLKPKSRVVYWLGLPIVRSTRMARDYQLFNKIYSARSEANGIEYINTWPLFEDEKGKYTSFGPDAQGTKRRLRKDDGLHFTVAGKLRFAIEIVRIINKDLRAESTSTNSTPASQAQN